MDLLGEWHRLVVHIPIILFILAAISDILYVIEIRKALWVGHVGILFGTLACFPAVLTGFGALDQMRSLSWQELHALVPHIANHELLGLATLSMACLCSFVRIGWLYQKWRVAPLPLAIMTIILLSLTYWTAITALP